jgi:hypothetical protein
MFNFLPPEQLSLEAKGEPLTAYNYCSNGF